jgi:ribosomal protein S18 acetylase RimI-like enzyme
MPTIRRARATDAPLIVDFNACLALESEGKALDRAILAPGVAAALADESKCLYFVAEDKGQVVGQMMVTFEWSDWRNGWLWWIQSVYVRADARRQGIFRSLFEHVEQLARKQGVVGIRLYVEQANHVAQATYEQLGMHKAGYFVLEKGLT